MVLPQRGEPEQRGGRFANRPYGSRGTRRYAVTSLSKLVLACVPSQKGFVADWPQRQRKTVPLSSAMPSRESAFFPDESVTFSTPVTM